MVFLQLVALKLLSKFAFVLIGLPKTLKEWAQQKVRHVSHQSIIADNSGISESVKPGDMKHGKSHKCTFIRHARPRKTY